MKHDEEYRKDEQKEWKRRHDEEQRRWARDQQVEHDRHQRELTKFQNKNERRGIALWSLNRLLRLFGLVVVVGTDGNGPMRVWIETARAYDSRCV